MISRNSVSGKIIHVLIFVQFVVIALVLFQHSRDIVERYDTAEREKAQLFIDMIEPVVSLQVSLGFEQAMAEQLHAMAPANRDIIALSVTDRNGASLFRYATHPLDASSSGITIVTDVKDPYSLESIGNIELHYSGEGIDQLRRHDALFQVKIAVTVLMVSIFLILAIGKILAPLRLLSARIQNYAPENGHCDLRRIEKPDDVGVIQNSIVTMLERIGEYSSRLQSSNEILEERVRERTLALEEANQQLEALSLTDPLTHLSNRRKFTTYFESIWSIYVRENRPIGMIIVDIDHFKSVNDRYGHAVGDRVLIGFARLMQQLECRDIDLIARFGGEEFVILLPGSTLKEVALHAGALQERIRAERFSDLQIAVTASMGIATLLPTRETDRHRLFELADRALYRAKEEGRDRIVCDDSL